MVECVSGVIYDLSCLLPGSAVTQLFEWEELLLLAIESTMSCLSVYTLKLVQHCFLELYLFVYVLFFPPLFYVYTNSAAIMLVSRFGSIATWQFLHFLKCLPALFHICLCGYVVRLPCKSTISYLHWLSLRKLPKVDVASWWFVATWLINHQLALI